MESFHITLKLSCGYAETVLRRTGNDPRISSRMEVWEQVEPMRSRTLKLSCGRRFPLGVGALKLSCGWVWM